MDVAVKLAEALTRKNDKLAELRIVVDACPLATFVTDDQGDCVYVNEAYQNLVGRSYREALNDGWRRIIHPDDALRISVFWANSVSNEVSFDQQFRCVRPDGTVIPVHCRAVRLPNMGYVGYVNATDGANCKFICRARANREYGYSIHEVA